MKLLIGGSPSKLFHLKEFGEELKKNGSEYKLVLDSKYSDGFPSRKISKWFQTKNQFTKLLRQKYFSRMWFDF